MSKFKELDGKKIEDCTPEEQDAIVSVFLESAGVVSIAYSHINTAGKQSPISVSGVLELLEVYEYVDQPMVYKTIHRVVYRNRPWAQFCD